MAAALRMLIGSTQAQNGKLDWLRIGIDKQDGVQIGQPCPGLTRFVDQRLHVYHSDCGVASGLGVRKIRIDNIGHVVVR